MNTLWYGDEVLFGHITRPTKKERKHINANIKAY